MRNKEIKIDLSSLTLSEKRVLECFSNYKDEDTQKRIYRIMHEFVTGFSFLNQFGDTVSIFGSARCHPNENLYHKAHRLAYNLAKSGFGIVTGGGPGVMEAANKGAHDAGGLSIGLNIRLPEQQRVNQYVKKSASFHYFFTRKVMLSFASQAYIFFPGGFGTLDEFFEMITLVQTEKIKPLPIILVHKKYWTPLLDWLENNVHDKFKAITKEDVKIYQMVDGATEAANLVKKMTKY